MTIPAANAVARLETMVANVLDREVTVADQDDLDLLLRVTNRAAAHWPVQFSTLVANPESPTNNELAAFVLLKTKEMWQQILMAEGSAAAADDAAPVIAAAGETAAADMA